MNYASYLERRGWGLSAVEAYRETKKSEQEQEAVPLPKALVNVAIGLVVFSLTQKVVDQITGDNIWGGMVWIVSPSGETKKKLPLRSAIRIIRKREWEFAEVVPVEYLWEAT